jgi:hypothetical protein
VSGINCDKVTHQQRQQVQQKLADTGLDLMHSERFIGYASNGQKQMNGNQLHSYIFSTPLFRQLLALLMTNPIAPPPTKSGWDVTVSPLPIYPLFVLGFGMPFPRLKRPWHSLPIQRSKPAVVSSKSMARCWPLSSPLPALSNF